MGVFLERSDKVSLGRSLLNYCGGPFLNALAVVSTQTNQPKLPNTNREKMVVQLQFGLLSCFLYQLDHSNIIIWVKIIFVSLTKRTTG